ncbi:hypothetical protein R6Q59_013128 [Mikania micrantha]
MVSLHNPIKKIQLLCDGRVKPIMTVPFYICNQQADEQCCFVLHEWCAKLPLEVQDYAVHGHTLFLLPEVHSKFFSIFKCAICDLPSNGFTYGCMMCEFYIDISCAFMPEEIVHDAHPGRILYKRHPSKTFGEYCKACEVFMHKSWVVAKEDDLQVLGVVENIVTGNAEVPAYRDPDRTYRNAVQKRPDRWRYAICLSSSSRQESEDSGEPINLSDNEVEDVENTATQKTGKESIPESYEYEVQSKSNEKDDKPLVHEVDFVSYL